MVGCRLHAPPLAPPAGLQLARPTWLGAGEQAQAGRWGRGCLSRRCRFLCCCHVASPAGASYPTLTSQLSRGARLGRGLAGRQAGHCRWYTAGKRSCERAQTGTLPPQPAALLGQLGPEPCASCHNVCPDQRLRTPPLRPRLATNRRKLGLAPSTPPHLEQRAPWLSGTSPQPTLAHLAIMAGLRAQNIYYYTSATCPGHRHFSPCTNLPNSAPRPLPRHDEGPDRVPGSPAARRRLLRSQQPQAAVHPHLQP